MSRRCLSLLLLLQFSVAAAQGIDTSAIIRARERLEFLCDSAQTGRATGTSGAVRTAHFIRNEFEAAGLSTTVRHFRAGSSAGHNVIGIRTSEKASKRWIIVISHFDGIGCRNGVVYQGADANASGIAALLELTSLQTPLNLMFAALDAHNEGCLGADDLWVCLKESGIRADQVRMVANIDIIGSRLCPVHKGWKDFMIALGGARYEDSMSACNSGLGLRLYFNYYESRAFTDMFYRKVSDHCVLLSKGIPCVMFTSGITMNTNKPGDTLSTLDPDLLSRRVELIKRWLEKLK